MSKLRKVQFFRNSSVVTTVTSHSDAVSKANTAFEGQLTNMADGELLLYRYQITPEGAQQPEPTVHTIVGVVRKPESGTSYVEILANYDMLTSQFDSLDVTGYKQAYVTVNTNDSSFTVQGIQENNGLIGVDGTQGVTINIEGAYDASNNKIATQSTVANAIAALDTQSDVVIASANNNGVVTLTPSVQEVNGIISRGSGNDITLAKVATTGAAEDVSYDNTTSGLAASDVQAAIDEVQGNIKDGKIQHNSTDVFSANTDTDLTLEQYDFVYDSADHKLGVNVQTPTRADNKIATMADIASLTGAMHYKGGVTAYPTPTADTKAGDTYIVTQRFEYPANSGTWYEVGDMLVATADGTSATYTVVQSNLTLGMGTGEVAANQTALTANEIVVAGSTGVQTTGYTFDAESTEGTTTIGPSSTNAKVPTSKNVYDAIQGLAVNSVSETVGVTDGSDSATVTDTLTVDGTAQAGQAFTIAGGDGVNVTGNASTQTITVAADVAAHSHQINTTTVNTDNDDYNLLKVDANGELSVSDTWDCGTY